MSTLNVSSVLPSSTKRRGIHPIYSDYLGESVLNDDYRLVKNNSYKFTSQLRDIKQAGISERTLTDSLEDSIATSSEMNKKRNLLNLSRITYLTMVYILFSTFLVLRRKKYLSFRTYIRSLYKRLFLSMKKSSQSLLRLNLRSKVSRSRLSSQYLIDFVLLKPMKSSISPSRDSS